MLHPEISSNLNFLLARMPTAICKPFCCDDVHKLYVCMDICVLSNFIQVPATLNLGELSTRARYVEGQVGQ